MQNKSNSLKLLKYETESTHTKTSTFNNSLPVGDIYGGVTVPQKLKLTPLVVRADSSDRDSSAPKKAKDTLHVSIHSTAESSDNSSDDTTPGNSPVNTKMSSTLKPSQFFRRTIIDAQNMKGSPDNTPEKTKKSVAAETYTPKSRRKQNPVKYHVQQQNNSKNESNSKKMGTFSDDPEVQKLSQPVPPSSENKVSTPKASYALKPSTFARGNVETEVFNINNFIFGTKVEERTLSHHIELIRKGLHYSTKLLKPPPESFIDTRKITLKDLKNKTQKTLLMDLDETLITSCTSKDNPDKTLQPDHPDPSIPPIHIKIRPGAKEFLERMKEHFEIIVFTASTSLYAETIIKELDPEKKFISYVLDRDFCLETKNRFFIKDLRLFKNRELKNLIIVDNLVHSFGFQIENGIPILEWKGDKTDRELHHLQNYLIKAKKYDDIRDYNRKHLKLLEFANAKVESAIEI